MCWFMIPLSPNALVRGITHRPSSNFQDDNTSDMLGDCASLSKSSELAILIERDFGRCPFRQFHQTRIAAALMGGICDAAASLENTAKFPHGRNPKICGNIKIPE